MKQLGVIRADRDFATGEIHPSLLAAWLLPLLLLLPLTTGAQAPFSCTTNSDDTITITGYAGPGGALTVSNTINGLAVTSIGNFAFQNHTNLTSVILPNNLTSVGFAAFQDCTNLTNVTLGTSVSNIGDLSFIECALRNVTFLLLLLPGSPAFPWPASAGAHGLTG